MDRIANALSGGAPLFPLDRYPWSERYAWVRDRFGVTWQVILVDEEPKDTIVPALLFGGAKLGKASDAMALYTRVFEGGRTLVTARYEEGEGPVGLMKHGRCELLGQELVLFDGPGEHAFDFDEGISLQILCESQEEIDRYWQKLTENGGEESYCGWLKDPFGVSWQVTPRVLGDWLSSSDREARERTYAALMKMRKLDLATLQAAFEGR